MAGLHFRFLSEPRMPLQKDGITLLNACLLLSVLSRVHNQDLAVRFGGITAAIGSTYRPGNMVIHSPRIKYGDRIICHLDDTGLCFVDSLTFFGVFVAVILGDRD